MNLDFEEGRAYMSQLVKKLTNGEKKTFSIGDLTITYPGYKKEGDYKLSIDGYTPKHTDIVEEIYNYTTSTNFNTVVKFLEEVYTKGTKTNLNIIDANYKHKLFWITLQEEINYPQPRYKGRRLPFQRFYEAALVHKEIISFDKVKNRTNNHGGTVPQLLNLKDIYIPSFYI